MMVYNPFRSEICICTSGSLAGCKTGGTAVARSCNTQTPHIPCHVLLSQVNAWTKIKHQGFSVDVFSWHL